jgi:DNA-binding transcriptional LysR family regulator
VSRAPGTRSPELGELRAFCAAVDLGGIGRAAQRLHLSQPAVSKRLKALEELVGARLLERSARGVSPTAEGARLYTHARRLIADVDELDGVIGQMRGSGETVHLAISHTAAEFVLPRTLVLMHRETSAAVEVVIANSRLVKRLIAEGRADIGVAAYLSGESIPGATVVPLIDDEIVIAVPLAHPWARRASITPAELLATPLVLRDPDAHTRQVIDEELAAAGLGPPLAACEVGSTQAAKDEAHELGLPTVMSRLTLTPADRLEIVPVDGLTFLRRFLIIHPPGALSPAAAHLVRAFQQTVADLATLAPAAAGDSPAYAD